MLIVITGTVVLGPAAILFNESAAIFPLSKNRTPMDRPTIASPKSLEILTLINSFQKDALRQHMPQSGFHRTHHCRTWSREELKRELI